MAEELVFKMVLEEEDHTSSAGAGGTEAGTASAIDQALAQANQRNARTATTPEAEPGSAPAGAPTPRAQERAAREAEERERQRELSRTLNKTSTADALPADPEMQKAAEALSRSQQGFLDKFLEAAKQFLPSGAGRVIDQARDAVAGPKPLQGEALETARKEAATRNTGGAFDAATAGGRAAVTEGTGAAGGGLAAAGAVGAGLIAADFAAKAVAGSLDSMAQNVQTAGAAAKMLASNDNLGAVTKVADGAAEALGKIPIVGQVFEAGLKLATTVVREFAEVSDAFVRRGRELMAYNPALAQANAAADVRSLTTDVREAQALGPSIARLTDAQSEASTEFRELLLPIKQFIVEVLAGVMQDLVEILRGLRILWEEIKVISVEGFHAVVEAVSLHLPTAAKIIDEIPNKMAEAVAKINNRQQIDILDKQLAKFQEGIDRLKKTEHKPDLVRRAANQGIGIPMLSP